MEAVERLVWAPVPFLRVCKGASCVSVRVLLGGSAGGGDALAPPLALPSPHTHPPTHTQPRALSPVALDGLGRKGSDDAKLLAQAVQQPARNHDLACNASVGGGEWMCVRWGVGAACESA